MKSFLFVTLQLFALSIFAQSPGLINYQGVARDANGVPLVNTTLGIQFEFLQAGSLTPVYTETQTIVTNSLGLFTTQIGKQSSGGLSAIDYQGGTLVLRLGIDVTGGSNFAAMGSQTLVSVPFSMHAQSVPVSYTNNILTIGKTSFTLNGSGAIYTASTGISIVSNSIITNTLPDQTVTINPGNSNIGVTGAYPNFTVASSPSLSLLSPGTLSISNGNTVDINPALNFTNNILTVGAGTNTVLIPSGSASLQGGGAASVSTLSPNSFSVNVPPTAISGGTNVSVSGTYPSFTVSSTPALGLTGNTLSISGGNSVTLPTGSLVGTGAANVTSVSLNTYSINVPVPVITPSTNISVQGAYPGYTISAAIPSLATSGGSISIVGSNSVAIPSASLIGTGAANVATLSANSYSINVPVPVITQSSNISVQGAYPNFTISAATPSLATSGGSISILGSNSVAIPAPNFTATGAANVSTLSSNSYSINVPVTSISQGSNVSIQGTYPNYTINANPTLSVSGNVLSISNGNSVPLPSNTIVALTTSVTGSGAAQVFTLGANDYSIHVDSPTLTISGQSLSLNGSNTVILPAGNVTIAGDGVATVSSSGNNYTVNVPASTYANGALTTGTSVVNITPGMTLTGNNLAVGNASNSVVLPVTTVTAGGIANVTSSGNDYTVNVPAPAYNVFTGSLTTGTVSTFVTPTLQLAGGVLTSGPASNSVNIPSASTVSASGVANVISSGNGYTVNVPAPTYANGALTTGTAVVDITPTMTLTGNTLAAGNATNSVVLPVTTVTTSGVANVTSSGNNYTVNVPAPVYNVFTGSLTTGTVSSFVTPTLQLSGGVLSSGPASNSVILPSATTVTSSGVANVSSSGNSYTVNVPAPSYANGALTTGTAVVDITPTMTLTGNNLAVGNATNNITLPVTTVTSSGVANVSSSGNSYTVNVPAPSYANGALTTGTAVVDITPTMTLTGNNLAVGNVTNNVILPVTTVTTSGAASLISSGNNYTVDVPPAALTATGGGISINGAGTNSFVLDVPSTTLSNGTNVTITGAHPNYTIASTPTLSLVGNNLTISGGNTIPLPSNTIAAVSTSLSGSGAASIFTLGPNDYDVFVPSPTLTMLANTLSINGGNAVAIAPTLSLTGNVLTVGPATNTIALNGASSQSLALLTANSLSITGGNSVAIAPTLSVTGNVLTVGPATNTVNLPVTASQSLNLVSANSLSITGGNSVAIAPTLSVTGNVLTVGPATNTVNLPVTASQSLNLLSANSLSITGGNSVAIAPTLSVTGNVLTVGPATNTVNLPVTASQSLNLLSANSLSITGGNSVAIAPTLSVTGNVLTVGPATNTVTIPVTPNTNLVGSGAANVSVLGVNSFSVDVPQTTLTSSTNVLVTGSYPNYTISSTPSLAVTGNSISINGGNTVALPVASTQSLNLLSANSLSITGGNSVAIAPTLSVTGNVLTVGPNTNTVNLPVAATQSLNLLSANSLSITGGNSVAIAPTLSVTGNVLTVGPNTNTVSLPVTATQSLNLLSANSLSITGGNSVAIAPTLSVTGNVLTVGPNTNTVNLPVAATQSLNLLSANSLSITGGNSVAIAPTLSVTGNVLTVGPNTNTVNLPVASTQSLNLLSANSLSITGGNSVAIAPTLSVTGNVLTVGPNTNTVNLPVASTQSLNLLSANSLSITGGNSVAIAPTLSVTGNVLTVGPNTNTVNLPVAATQSLNLLSANSLSITGGNSVAIAPTLSVTGNVLTVGPNTNTVNLPVAATQSLNLLSANSLSITGGNSVAIAPTLSVTGNVLTVGPNTNTVAIPVTPNTNLVGSGAANVTFLSVNSYSIDVPQPVLTSSTNVLVAGSYPNYTISSTPSLAVTGNSISINGGNTVALPVAPSQSLNLLSANSLSITGGNSVAIAPTLSVTGNVLTVGPATNTVNLPSQITPTISGGGLAIATQTGSAMTVSVTPYSYSAATGILSSGTNSVNITPTVGLSGNVLTVGPSTNNITLPTTPSVFASGAASVSAGPGYTINVPATNIGITTNPGTASVNVTGVNSFQINVPPAITPTISGGGLAVATQTGSAMTVSVTPYSFSAATGILSSGTNSVSITPAVSISGNVLTVGPSTNNITLPATPSVFATGAASVSSGPGYTINVPATSIALTNTAGVSAITSPTTNNFVLNIPPAITPTISGGGLAVATQTGSAMTVSVTPYSYTTTTGILGSGSNTVNINPVLALTGSSLSVGSGTNQVNLGSISPWRQATGSVTLASSSDNVGIGNNTPTGKLDVASSAAAHSFSVTNTNAALTTYAGYFDGGLYSRGKGTSNTGFALQAQNSVNTDLFTVTNLGRVGIGTTSPAQELQVETAANTAVSFVGGATSNVNLNFGTSVNHFLGSIRYDNSSNSFNFWTNNTANRLSILNNGNIGIGTAAPSYALDIHASGTVAQQRIVSHHTNTNAGGQLNLAFSRGTEAVPVAVVNGDAIGTISFDGYATGAGYTPGALIRANATENFSSSSTTGSKMDFITRGNGVGNYWTRMSITSGGGVAIGTQFAGGGYVAPSDGLIIEGNVGIGNTVPHAALQFTNTITNRKIVLYETANNDQQFYGFGINGGTLRYQVDATGADHIFYAGVNSTTSNELMRIKGNGYVGIGTSTPDAPLNVDGNVDLGANNTVTGVISGAFGSFNTVAGNRAYAFGSRTSASTLGSMTFGDWSGGGPTILTSSASDQFSARFNGGYRFFTDAALTNSLGVFFSGSGNVGIGTASPGYQLHVEKNTSGTLAFFDNNTTTGGTCLLAQVTTANSGIGSRYAIEALASNGTGINFGIQATGTGGTNAYGVYGSGSGGSVFSIGVLGSASSGAGSVYGVYCSGNGGHTGTWGSVSDQKFKENVTPLTGALDKVLRLEPKTYTMKTSEYPYMNFAQGTQIGLIAQEVEKVIPELVVDGAHPGPINEETKEAGAPVLYKGMNYIGLTPVLVQAIKEQQQQIEDLKKMVAEQQKQIDRLLKK